jgi:hypothetical protein
VTARRSVSIAAALAVFLPAPGAAADPYEPRPGEVLHLRTPTTARTDGGTDLRLPPGYFLDEPAHDTLDVEMKRLQEAETRLRAENDSLRRSAKGISFGWYALGSAVAGGLALGYYLGTR